MCYFESFANGDHIIRHFFVICNHTGFKSVDGNLETVRDDNLVGILEGATGQAGGIRRRFNGFSALATHTTSELLSKQVVACFDQVTHLIRRSARHETHDFDWLATRFNTLLNAGMRVPLCSRNTEAGGR